MAKDSQNTILRIGLVQGGHIIEERLIRKPGPVSIGQTPRNTFVIPASRLPASFTLFEFENGRHLLRFVRGMDGRVSAGEQILDLKSLVTQRHAQARANHFIYPLGAQARGKIVLGDLTLLFQVVPAAAAEAEALPRELRPRISEAVNWFYAGLLGALTLLLFGVIGGLDYWWRVTGQFLDGGDLRGRQRLLQKLQVEVEFQEEKQARADLAKDLLDNGRAVPAEEAWREDDNAAGDGEDVDLPPSADAGSGRKELSPEEAARRKYERQVSHVRNSTVLRFLVSRGPGGEGGYANTLKDGATAKKLSDAWEGSGGVAVAALDGEGRYRGGPKLAEADGAGGSRYVKLENERYTGRIETGKVEVAEEKAEVKVKLRIHGEVSGGSGSPADKAGVTGVFRRRQGAIRYCYERALKVHPEVQGKVTIQFTIGAAGRITEIAVITDTTGVASIGECILSKVRTWRFQPPEKGSARFTYPFILSRG